MNIEEAIRTAIDYETKIHDLYRQAHQATGDSAGKRVFSALQADERRHLDYLQDRLVLWLKNGRLAAEKLESVVPDRQQITRALEPLRHRMAAADRTDEKQMLSKALEIEVETSRFYRQMVNELDGEVQQMFARFLAIEDEHIAIVQAQLDYISHTGYWFDFKEFDME